MRKTTTYIIHIVIWGALCINVVYAQQLRFFHFDKDNGLPSAAVTDIVQDDFGFVWVATINGLSRFDGNTVKTFRHQPNKPSLNSNDINKLLKSKKGNFLWIGTQKGLNKFIIDKGLFVNQFNNSLYNLYVEQKEIYDIFEQDNGDIWIAMTNVFGRFSESRQQFERFNIDTLNGALINTIAFCNHTVWLGVQGKGLYYYSLKNKQITKFNYSSNTNVIPQVKNVVLRKNKLYAATESGIVVINPFNLSIENTILKDTRIAQLGFQNDSIIWFLPYYRGLSRINIHNDVQYNFEYQKCNNEGINSNTTISLELTDKKQIVWVGTLSKGLNYSIITNNPFSEFDNFKYPSDVKKIECFGMHETDDKKILFSTNYAVLYYDMIENKIHEVDLNEYSPGYNENYVSYIIDDKHGNWWIGAVGGVIKYVPETGKKELFSKVESQSNSIILDRINYLFEESDTSLLIATFDGVARMNTQTGSTSVICNTGNSPLLKGQVVAYIYKDSKERIWICSTGGGLYCMQNDEIIKHYRYEDGENNNLTNNFVLVVYEDNYSRRTDKVDYIWAGLYNGGLNKIDIRNNKIDYYDESNGLSNNSIYGILEDNNQQLWMSTDDGITVMKYNGDETFRVINKTDGLRGEEFYQNAFLEASNGLFIYCADEGLVSFYPDSIKNVQQKANIQFTYLKINYREIEPWASDIIPKNINVCKSIKLNHNQSDLSIGFTAINFDRNKQYSYEYKLENYDDNWIEAGNRTEAVYTNLPYGTYIFKVRISGGDFVHFVEGERSIEIEIIPPIYARWWFIAICSLIAVALLFSIYIIRLNVLKKQKNELEYMVAQKTKDISEVNAMLEERNETVEQQKEELSVQAQNLKESNELLERRGKEVTEQRDIANAQKNLIEKQKNELEKYRYHLEDLIEERTAELIVAKDKAEESDKLKMAFLANMSHEIRTPLNAIVGFTDLLYDGEISHEERKNYLRYVSKNSDALLMLIDDIIDIAKIEAGQITTEEQRFSLNNLCDELFESFKLNSNAIDLNIIYTNENSDEQLIIDSDKYRIRQVVNNLVNNAMKFTEKGYVKFGFEVEQNNNERYIKFHVIDTGIGIAGNKIEKIFNRFYKVDGSRAKLYRGTGLGLSISKSIVEYLGGEIWVESEVNSGSKFYFTIPLKRLSDIIIEKELKGIDIDYNSYKWNNKIILIAEDEDTNFEYLKKALSRTEATILRAKTGEEALLLFKSNNPHITLLDIKMPVKSGIEVAKTIRENNTKAILVAQTAFAMAEDKIKILAVGFDDILSKPIKRTNLLDTLKKHLS